MSNRLMLPCVLLLGFLVSAAKGAPAVPYSVSSPDGRTVVEVKTDGALRYAVTRDGAVLLNDSRLGFEFKDAASVVIGDDAEADFGLDGVEVPAHFFDFMGALEVDDHFGDAEEVFGEVRQADVRGEKEFDVDAALRKEPAGNHVVKEVAGVEAVFAEEKNGERAGGLGEVGPAD